MRASLAPLTFLASHPVTRRHPVRTIWRWASWQLRQRITQRPKVMPFIEGTRLAVYPHEGLTGCWYLGFPDYEEMMFLRRFLRAGDLFFDVGANAGAFSVLAAGCGCRVVAFEPVPESFKRLQENIELNSRCGSIVGHNQAVGAAAGSVQITTGFGTGNHVLRDGETSDSVEVAVVTLDDVARTSSPPTFIKMDVEGHEGEVIKGAGEVLRSEALQGLLLETFRPHNWKQPKLRTMEATLAEHGFVPCQYNVEQNQILRLIEPHEGENNTFYFRFVERIEARLRTIGNQAGFP